uniref:UbiE/COQ5 methyltransferase n=1 Tax=uncultured bacterium 98 TaxID=698395 RepID=E3T6L0_9BACT|nr:UbiE/COQ5 methyltransferase [uncultured bacterium 98]
MREWNAAVYHRVSNPQADWGLPVLARLPLSGGELVLDVGCGTGRITERLLERLPDGRAIAIDQSANMIDAARGYLGTGFAGHVAFVQADAAALPFASKADAILSTATFHWIRDHDRLFASLGAALKPGGRLVAQCGGAGNLERIHERCRALIGRAPYSRYFSDWSDPWEFADAPATEARLRRAGFVDIHTWIEAAPIVHADAAAFREFAEHVICRPFLARIGDAGDRDRFMTELTESAAQDSPAFELDYWRLNIDARRQ